MKTKGLIIILLGIFLSTSAAAGNPPKAVKGKMDVRSYSFQRQGCLRLAGEWAFHWKKLYAPLALRTHAEEDTQYTRFPAYWNSHPQNKSHTGEGYATYSLDISFSPDQPDTLYLYLKEFLTSYRLYVNGKLTTEVGKVGTTANSAKPAYYPVVLPVSSYREHIEIVLQVANFSHTKGGPYNHILLGLPNDITRLQHRHLALDFLLTGSMLVIALYFLLLFLLRRHDTAALFFALFAFFIALRITVSGEQTIHLIMPQVGWGLAYKIDYITFYAVVPTVVAFFYAIFPKDVLWRVTLVFWGLSAVAVSLVLFTPPGFFTSWLWAYQALTFLAMAYILFALGRALYFKRQGSRIMGLGSLVLFALATNDILHGMDVIYTAELSYLGVFLFSWFPVFLITQRFIMAEKHVISLNRSLLKQKLSLEEDVEKQTHTLRESAEELRQQNEEISAQRDELKEQQIELRSQHHYIKASVEYAHRLQQSLLPGPGQLSQWFDSFVLYRPKDIVSGDFYWFAPPSTHHGALFMLADCTGHGVPGAFMSLVANQLLQEIVHRRGMSSPGKILATMDKEVQSLITNKDQTHNDGMDVSLCCVKKSDGGNLQLTFAGAKQDMVIFRNKDGTHNMVKGVRRSVGNNQHTRNALDYENQHFEVFPGDLIYLYTDGIIDQQNHHRKRFGTPRLLERLAEIHQKPLDEQHLALTHTLDAYQKGEPQRDDITVVALKIKAI